VSNQRTSITSHLHALSVERHPETAPQALRQVGAYLADEFSTCGWTTKRQLVRFMGRAFPNILAIRTPTGQRTKSSFAPLVIGAHYDTVVGSPGADDNASGLVVLLQLAQRLSKTPLARPVWLVAFCLEEQGLLGSAAFTSRLKTTRQPLHGAIILECVGYATDEAGSQRRPPGIPVPLPTAGNFLGIIGNDASRGLLATVEQSAKRVGPPLISVALAVPGCGETLPDVRRSDHAAFWDEGFPAVMLTDTANFRNPHYHQPTDRIDTLNLPFLEAVLETVAGSALSIAGTAG
jgi:Zn-dependent M28 family amino/carboxypeptidase